MATDTLSKTLSALADPTRRAILERLETGGATVGELAEPFELSLPTVSKHLKVLERAGLIERSKQAQWRHCTIRLEPLREAEAWLERFHALWSANFGRLDALLGRMASGDATREDEPEEEEPLR